MAKDFWRLILVTNKGRLPVKRYLEFVKRCIKAGVTAVQLREKELSYEELLYFGKSLKKFLDEANVSLIINDDVSLCRELNASGVHLGQADGSPIKARTILGPDKIIGLSVNSIAQIYSSNSLPLDYIGLSAIFPSKNKGNIETIWGLDGLKKAAAFALHPIIAIGGINESNVLPVINSGAQGIAAIGVFHDAVDPYLQTQNLIKIVKEACHDKQH